MAKLMFIGEVTNVEIIEDPDDEEMVLARCVPGRPHGEACLWERYYGSYEDATVYALMDRGDLESVKLGGLRRVPAAAVEAYVARLRAAARVEAITDPCANGCSNPAVHAEGGHDV